MVRNVICSGIREAGFLSLLADEMKDCCKCEQMSVVHRYVDHAAVIHEHLEVTADKLTEYIVNVLEQLRLDPSTWFLKGMMVPA